MIQRIQSVYLFLSFAILVPLFFVPLAQFLADGEQVKLTVWGIYNLKTGASIVPATYMGILAVLSTALPLVNLFLFRKRWLQIRLCIVEMVFLIGIQIYIVYYVFSTQTTISGAGAQTFSTQYSVADILPLAALIFTYLAYRGVVKDETLIKSLNRIR